MRRPSGWWIAAVVATAVLFSASSALAMVSESKNIDHDGYDDAAAMYDYGHKQVGFWEFDSSAPTSVTPSVTPRLWWKSAKGWGGAKSTTPLLADVTGDHRADVVAAYAYNKGQMGLFVLPASDTATSPAKWWKSKKKGWAPSATKLTTSRSYTGIGPSTPVALYKSGGRLQLWIFTKSGDTFVPVKLWQSAKNWGKLKNCKVVGGDFNHDGKGDVALLYNFGHNQSGLWTFISNGAGYDKHLAWKSAKGGWSWKNSKLLSGDVDGDISDEIVIAYKYKDTTGMWVFQPTDATVSTLNKENWGRVHSYVWNLQTTLLDLNHDHKADIATLGPGTEDQGVSWNLLLSKGTSFDNDLMYVLWESAPTAWRYSKVRTVP